MLRVLLRIYSKNTDEKQAKYIMHILCPFWLPIVVQRIRDMFK
jgi:hypothetical protein